MWGLYNLKKDNAKKIETESKNDNDDSEIKIGTGIALDSSIRNSTAQANAKYSRPDYNPETRKQYYDDSSAHKKAIDDAFANGKTVRDPYTGAELVKKQRDAKIKYGEDWQRHAAEADHIDPLNQVANRTKRNPFLTTEDIREIGNSEDNYQVISRKLNQGSKEVGKGGSTQKDWGNDTTRMEGVGNSIENGESVSDVRQRIIETGKEAENRNNSRALKKSVQNAVGTAHDAGISGAKNAGATALTMAGIINLVSVIKGEKSGQEAIEDTIKDGGKAAVMGYAMGSGMTIVSQTMSYSSSQFIQALAENNVPGKVITAVIVTGDTLKKWGDGEITTQECIVQLGEKGLNMAVMGYSMTVGQALIPIPVVGGAVGALVGSMLAGSLYNQLVYELKTRKLEHKERLRIIAECNEAAEQARKFRAELEAYLENYFKGYKSCFDTALSSMQFAFETGDADGVIAGANSITRKLGGRVAFENVTEFKTFLDSDEDDVL